MSEEILQISKLNIRKLIGTGNGDAALLYLYLEAGGSEDRAASDLSFSAGQTEAAMRLLRQTGLVAETHRFLRPAERPVYTEQDFFAEAEKNNGFIPLRDDIESRFGRLLGTEELKTLLCFRDYLGLPDEVISTLVSFCINRAKARGNAKAPSMRVIEKEAYYWADEGIDTMETAVAYVKQQEGRQSKLGSIRRTLQINGRKLTVTEEGYINKWLGAGFGEPEIALAYEKTCLQKGGLIWSYMDAILMSWQSKNLFTLEQITENDRPPEHKRTGAGKQEPEDEIDPMIRKMLQQRKQQGGKN